MKIRNLAIALTALSTLSAPAMAAEQFIPIASFWTGPYAAGGSAFGDAMADYYRLLNERDGGINGVKLTWEKCETGYKTDRTVECYEKMKAGGMPFFHPLTTGGTYALFERSVKDQIPLLTPGYGRTDGSDGRVFPYLFPAITNYWSQSTAKIKFIGQQMGGMDKLKGMKIANLHHDSAYGKETTPVLKAQAEKYGFEFKNFPIAHPGLDQKAVWLQISRRYKPDWVILRGWGVMNPTALKEAARVRFPANRIVGVWWSGSEEDTVPAGAAAEGFYAAGFHAGGTAFPVIQDMIKYVYDPGKGDMDRKRVGSIYFNRGVTMAMLGSEAIRDAMKLAGENRPVTGAEVQKALEQLTFDKARLTRMGAIGLMPEFSITCKNHEGSAPVKFQQWKGGKWHVVTDWIATDQSIVRPMVEASAAKYATEKKQSLRDCS